MTEKEYIELADLLYPDVQDISFYMEKYPARQVKGEVTRVAPSPTGYLHIGTVFQCLVDRMLAGEDGVFYLRLEDTDTKREIKEAGQILYDMMSKFELRPDEGYCGDNSAEIGNYGPYRQTNRLPIYYAFAHELVKRGRAFPCFCEMTHSKDEVLQKREEELENSNDIAVKDPCRDLHLEEIKAKLQEGKTYALRLRSNGDGSRTREFADEILGKKELRENAKDDILIKSNGIPVYAFAHIVDDTLMHTTVVVRGQDWYQSLPVHIELSEAFGFKPFRYAHTPNICVLNEVGNKRKISKRKDTFADVRTFLKMGYPIRAVLEYLMNILNSDFEIWRKNNPELDMYEFPFKANKIGVTNPLFDFDKLNDISKTMISRFTAKKVYEDTLAWAREWKEDSVKVLEDNKDILISALSIDRGGERPRKDITTFSEVLDLYNYVLPDFEPKFNFDLGKVKKENLIGFLYNYISGYKVEEDNRAWFECVKIKALRFDFVDNKLYKAEPNFHAGNVSDASKFIRLAITGRENSPELYSIMKIIGEDEVKKRINKIIEYIEKI